MDRQAPGEAASPRAPVQAAAVFVLSGFSALAFEVLWVRLASHSLGVTTWAVAVVVSTFMAGLALGGILFGPVSDRRRHPARLYAALEVGIGLTGLLASLVLTHLPPWDPGPQIAVIAAVLLVPCTLMGGTLPALGRAVAQSGPAAVARLYAANTAGAVAATLLADWVLVRYLGVGNALGVAASGSVLAATLVWLSPLRDIAVPARVREHLPFQHGRVYLAYGLAGFVALGLQIGWTRLIMAMTRPSIYNFSMVLAIFLAGLSLGSAASAAWAGRVANPRGWLGRVLAAIAVATFLGMALLRQADLAVEALGYAPAGVPPVAWSVFGCSLRSLALFGIPTFLMGVAFSLAARLVVQEGDTLGTSVGRLCTANTVGGIFGSVLTAFVLLPSLGLFRTVMFLACLGAFAGAWVLGSRCTATRTAWAALTLAALLLPGSFLLDHLYGPVWADRWGVIPETIRRFRDDSYATVAVADTPRGSFLMMNSTRMMGTALEGRRYARLMGHLPTLLHPNPRRALVIAFGCGMSAGALSVQPELARITCVELSPAVLAAGDAFREANLDVLRSPKVEFVLADGRNYLQRSQERFDVITLEPPPPTQAGVVNLYSADYYELCRERLTDDGIVCQWVPVSLLDEPDLRLVTKAFLTAFPDATLWEGSPHDYMLIGSKRPLRLSAQALESRMQDPALRASLAEIGVDGASSLLSCFLRGPRFLAERTADTLVTTDDRPYLEYSVSVRPRWDPPWRQRDLTELWPLVQDADREQVVRLSSGWQALLTLSDTPLSAEVARLSLARTAFLDLGGGPYVRRTLGALAAQAESPDPETATTDVARLWVLYERGQGDGEEAAALWSRLAPADRDAMQQWLRGAQGP